MKKTMKEKSLAKYDKKIAWAKGQKQSAFPCEDDMEEAIGLSWRSKDCPYCGKFFDSRECFECPLNPLQHNKNYAMNSDASSRICCNGLWMNMASSKTWEEWVENARKVRAYIEEHG